MSTIFGTKKQDKHIHVAGSDSAATTSTSGTTSSGTAGHLHGHGDSHGAHNISTTSTTTTTAMPIHSSTTTQATTHPVTTGTHTGTHTTGTHTATTTHPEKVVLSEEKLVVGKEEHNVGRVDIAKRIEKQTAKVPITLEREVVTVERRPVSSGTALSSSSTTSAEFGKPIDIVTKVHAEQAVASKQIVPTEQLLVHKSRVGDTQMLSGNVRSENVEVKRDVNNVDAVAWKQSATGAAGTRAGQASDIMDASGRVVAHEEKLLVGKQDVEAGRVQVTKHVTSSAATAPVHLEHDELDIQRTSLAGASGVAVPDKLTEGSAHINLSAEQAKLGKVVVPKEEVVIRKGVQQEQHTVTGELARERIDLRTSGEVDVDQCTDAACKDTKRHHAHYGSEHTVQPGVAGAGAHMHAHDKAITHTTKAGTAGTSTSQKQPNY